MTDDRTDDQIRALVIELVDATPPPPTWEAIHARLAAQAAPGDEGDAMTTIPTDPPPGVAVADLEEVDGLPTYAQPEGRSRPRWRPIAAAGGAVGIIVGGSFAYAAFNGTDGAPTPEAAVERFVDSLAGEDAIGALESLPPSEREALVDTARDLAGEAERLGLTAGLDLGDVGGFELEIDGLTLRSEPLGDGVTAVHLDGTLVSATTGAELPLGDVVREAVTDDGLGNFESGVAGLREVFAEEDVFVVAVEEGGGWHASAWYTIAEYVRRAEDLPVPAFGTYAVPPVGADSPEAAVRQYYEALNGADLPTALALMDPDEGRVLYDYGPLFFDQAQPTAEAGTTTLERIDLSTAGGGRDRVVTVTGMASTTTYPDGSTYRYDADGRCVRSMGTPAPDDQWGEPFDETTCREDPSGEIQPWEWDAMLGADVVTTERDGRWFLRPARSAGATLVAGARHVPDAPFTADDLEEGAPFGLLFRVWNLVGGYGTAGFFGPWVYSSESDFCYSTTDEYGGTVTDCYDVPERCSLEPDEEGNVVEVCEAVSPSVDPVTGEVLVPATTVVFPPTGVEEVGEEVEVPADDPDGSTGATPVTPAGGTPTTGVAPTTSPTTTGAGAGPTE